MVLGSHSPLKVAAGQIARYSYLEHNTNSSFTKGIAIKFRPRGRTGAF